MSILNKILSNPDNFKLLTYLNIDRNKLDNIHLKHYTEIGNYFPHEGLADFYNLQIPDNTKYYLNTNGILVNPLSGQIFAFQFGRSEIGFRCNLKKNKFSLDKPGLAYFTNFDGTEIIDISVLGANWAISINFVDSMDEQIKWSFENSN